MKKPTAAVPDQPGGQPVFADAKWVAALPTVCEYLTHDSWDDGQPREVSTVVIKAQEGRVLACLNDHELRRGLYVSGDDVMAALKGLERAVAGPQPDWRKWGGRKEGKKRT